MQVVLMYLREFFVVSPISKFKNNLTNIFEYFMNDLKENILEFAQSVSHAYCRLLRTQTSCLFLEFYMTTENRFPFAIKMPKKSNYQIKLFVRHSFLFLRFDVILFNMSISSNTWKIWSN